MIWIRKKAPTDMELGARPQAECSRLLLTPLTAPSGREPRGRRGSFQEGAVLVQELFPFLPVRHAGAEQPVKLRRMVLADKMAEFMGRHKLYTGFRRPGQGRVEAELPSGGAFS